MLCYTFCPSRIVTCIAHYLYSIIRERVLRSAQRLSTMWFDSSSEFDGMQNIFPGGYSQVLLIPVFVFASVPCFQRHCNTPAQIADVLASGLNIILGANVTSVTTSSAGATVAYTTSSGT